MKYKTLVLLMIIVVSSLVFVNITKKETKTDYYDLQIQAVNKTKEAFNVLKDKKEELNIEIDERLDPIKSGMIGDMAPLVGNSITTSLGDLKAKQTSTNPNFTSLIMDYLMKLNIKENDSVAVNFSSSFPALNVGVLIALDTLNIKSYIMSSLGASTYGANIIEFNYLIMEETLYDAGIINRQTEVMSLGGDNDNLSNISLNDEAFINGLYETYNYYHQIKEPNIEKNVKYRYRLYKENLTNIKAFINVGGTVTSRGLGIKEYDNGIIKPKRININKSSGLIDYFLNDGVSVINLLNIVDLANKNNLEVFDNKDYEIGVGDSYYKYKYNEFVVAITIVIVVVIILIDAHKRENEKKIKEFEILHEKTSDWRV